MPEKRGDKRFPRRFDVRFWRHGEEASHSGFTTNISKSGIFLGTSQTLFPGERVRVEVVDPEHGFVAEGRVVRVHRVSLALRHIEQPGVGVRFLLPEELVYELLPPAARGAPPRIPLDDEPEPARPADATSPAPQPAVATAPVAELAGRPIVAVEFNDRSAFLAVYHRDLAMGGLFVSTDDPPALHETVVIELQPPLDGAPPLRFAAKVVHRIEPGAAVGGGRNVLSGVGVQMLDPERVKAELAPILAELRKQPG